MKIIPFLSALAVTSISLSFAPPSLAQGAEKSEASGASTRPSAPVAASQAFELMMDALKDDDYNAFISMGDAGFQRALSKPAFEQVAAQIGPRSQDGCKATFLDSLQKGALCVYLWKIEFKNGDDVLAQISMGNGKVAGFFLT